MGAKTVWLSTFLKISFAQQKKEMHTGIKFMMISKTL